MKAFLSVCLVPLLGALACDSHKSAQTSPEPAAAKAAPAKATPAELGKQAGDLYVKMLAEARALVEAKPDAATLKPKIAALKEKYVKQLVEIGRKRQAMSPADRGAFDSGLRRVMMGLPSNAVEWLGKAVNEYRPADSALAEELSSLNILTQYTNFELLRKQAPKEADRLGLP